jgi:hypothetical protein
MSLKIVLMVNAVLGLLFGLGFLFAPEMVLSQYAVEVGAGGAYMSRFFGAALLGYAALAWMMSDSGPSDAREAGVTGLLVANGAGLVISIMMMTNGIANEMGWSTVVIYAFFTGMYGYYRFMAK